MENQNSSFGLHTKWLSTKNLLYPCNSKEVKRQDKLYCYLLVTSHILPYVGGDWVKTADWCRRSERGWAAYCFQSSGEMSQARPSATRQQMKTYVAGRQRREGVHLRRDPRCDEQQPAGSARRGLLRGRDEVQGLLLLRDGNDPGHPASDPAAKRAACQQWAKGEDLAQCLAGAGACG